MTQELNPDNYTYAWYNAQHIREQLENAPPFADQELGSVMREVFLALNLVTHEGRLDKLPICDDEKLTTERAVAFFKELEAEAKSLEEYDTKNYLLEALCNAFLAAMRAEGLVSDAIELRYYS